MFDNYPFAGSGSLGMEHCKPDYEDLIKRETATKQGYYDIKVSLEKAFDNSNNVRFDCVRHDHVMAVYGEACVKIKTCDIRIAHYIKQQEKEN